MPELPEVETVARQLAPHLEGRVIRSVEVLDKKLDSPSLAQLEGRRIVRVHRLGKQVLMELSASPKADSPLWLCFHLRMSGRLIMDGCQGGQKEKHLRARLHLDQGTLHFYDLRRFGLMRVAGSPREAVPHGLDPLTPEFTPDSLAALLSGARGEIKPWLLRQDRVAGIGNIYASEILFDCRINPHRAPGSLSAEEIKRLHASTVRILKLAIENCGTTFSDFQDSRGESGSFQNLLAVYAREGDPCKACGQPLTRIVQAQRSTFYCENCQRG